jgi:hypothetical protein
MFEFKMNGFQCTVKLKDRSFVSNKDLDICPKGLSGAT